MKDIKGYEGKYAITSCGKVYSYFTKKFLKLGNVGVYKSVKLQGKDFLIHRLVAEAYLDNPDNLPCVNHKDENTTNNCLNNLEWCTYKYNRTYGTAIERQAENMKAKWSDETYRQLISDKVKQSWVARRLAN